MTRDELIEAIRKLRNNAGPSDPQDATEQDLGYWRAAVGILELAHQLDFPPAMAWQAEPSGDCHAYVEGAGDSPTQVCYFDPVPGVNHGWEYCTNYGDWRPLNGRRVCPIPAPPELPKRGDA